jgi:hypothetical protein
MKEKIFMEKKIEHMCFFKYKESVNDNQKELMVSKFQSLLPVIDGLEEVSVGLNTTDEVEFINGYGSGLRMLFTNRDLLHKYLVHPEHLKASEYVFSIIDKVSVVDFEI